MFLLNLEFSIANNKLYYYMIYIMRWVFSVIIIILKLFLLHVIQSWVVTDD